MVYTLVIIYSRLKSTRLTFTENRFSIIIIIHPPWVKTYILFLIIVFFTLVSLLVVEYIPSHVIMVVVRVVYTSNTRPRHTRAYVWGSFLGGGGWGVMGWDTVGKYVFPHGLVYYFARPSSPPPARPPLWPALSAGSACCSGVWCMCHSSVFLESPPQQPRLNQWVPNLRRRKEKKI